MNKFLKRDEVDMTWKDAVAVFFIFLLVIFVVIWSWRLFTRCAYYFYYEPMVRETIQESVKKEYLSDYYKIGLVEPIKEGK